ncbi:MAG: hypothetical protein OXN92_16695 [Gammaproteobacteria bacterium]|nr:hypothetical protein [Gammaproteobacteria bacterium]MXW67640.1 hypothetical protein [Candidatus Palauibacter irciniicola]MXX73135.1 hypothetical protein [Gemmatimonadota bacterium]MYG76407.1 hypothetical protein [Acidobacteriota bacterium]
MVKKPRIAHTLVPSLLLAASAAFPVGASAQTAPPFKSALSAAMAEVRRSPFYSTSRVEGLSIVGMASVAVPHAGYRLDPDSTEGPSLHRVFWPTLGAVFLSEFVFLYNVFDDESDVSGDVFGTAVLVVGPPAVARIMGARFTSGLLGSAAGLGLGYGLFRLGLASGLDDSVAYWSIPLTHALLTTVISRL